MMRQEEDVVKAGVSARLTLLQEKHHTDHADTGNQVH